jgi:hypothetical protein
MSSCFIATPQYISIRTRCPEEYIATRLIILTSDLTSRETGLHQRNLKGNRHQAYNRRMSRQKLAPRFGRFANLEVPTAALAHSDPRVGFIVTNLDRPAKRVGRFHNQRGTTQQWIKEGKNAVKWTRLSCHDFLDNQVRLQLFVLAYNLGNFLRQAVLPREVRHWTLTTLREKLIKVGAKVVRHSRQVIFQMAEVAVSRELFRTILERIGWLRLPMPLPS